MSQWIAACQTDDIEPEDVIPFQHEGVDYAIYRVFDEKDGSQTVLFRAAAPSLTV